MALNVFILQFNHIIIHPKNSFHLIKLKWYCPLINIFQFLHYLISGSHHSISYVYDSDIFLWYFMVSIIVWHLSSITIYFIWHCLQCLFVSSDMLKTPFFWKWSNILLYMQNTFCLFIFLLMDIWVTPKF